MHSYAPGWQPPTLEHMQALLPQYQFVEMLGAGGMVVLTTHLEVAFSAQVIVVELGGRTPRA